MIEPSPNLLRIDAKLRELREGEERRERITSSLVDFACHVDADYKPAWFHKFLFSKLEQVRKREILRLIIEMPPQHGKTRSTSQIFPAFVFGHNPKEKIIAVSFDNYLTTTNNRAVQSIIDSEEYREVFQTRINSKSSVNKTEGAVKNSDVFDIISGGKISGKYSSTTINGAISGRGFTIGIIDDPVKGAEAADSPTIRQKTWNWYESEFSKRKAPNAAIIIMTTRWNEDDLVGRLLRLAKADPRADQWEVLSLPAMFEQRFAKPYDIRTIEDEGLWLDYYGQEHYEKERANTSTYYFSALMQQRPSAHEGNVFKRQWYLQKNGQAWSLPHLNGEMKSCCAYWDLAYSENPKADQTAGCLMLTDKSMNEWIADMRFGRWEIAKRNQEILAKCIEWGELFPNIKVYLESGMGAGVQDVLELKKLLIHNGIKAETDNVKDNKVFRATKEIGSFQSASQSGMIKFCEGEWNEPALLELSRLIEKETATGMEFTGGHDDILDALVGCHRKLTKPKLPNFFGAN